MGQQLPQLSAARLASNDSLAEQLQTVGREEGRREAHVVSSFVTEGSVNYDAKMCHQGLTVDCITNALCQKLGEHTTQERMAIYDDIQNQFKVIQGWIQ